MALSRQQSPLSLRCLVPAFACVLPGALLHGCAVEYPGQSLGTFHVTAFLTENTCGTEAVPAQNTFEFDVDFRAEDSIAYWVRAGEPLFQGTLQSDGEFRFQTASVWEAYGAEFDQAGCSMSQGETISGLFVEDEEDEEAPTAAPDESGDDSIVLGNAFEGSLTIDFQPTTGSDCGLLQKASGGLFDSVPCGVRYEFEAVALDEQSP